MQISLDRGFHLGMFCLSTRNKQQVCERHLPIVIFSPRVTFNYKRVAFQSIIGHTSTVQQRRLVSNIRVVLKL